MPSADLRLSLLTQRGSTFPSDLRKQPSARIGTYNPHVAPRARGRGVASVGHVGPAAGLSSIRKATYFGQTGNPSARIADQARANPGARSTIWTPWSSWDGRDGAPAPHRPGRVAAESPRIALCWPDPPLTLRIGSTCAASVGSEIRSIRRPARVEDGSMGTSSGGLSERARVALRLGHLVDRLLSIGTYAEESEHQRARRRIMLAAIWISTILTTPFIVSDLITGYPWSAFASVWIPVVTAGVLITLHLRPRWFAGLITALLGTVLLVLLVQTALFGGLYGSSLIVVFGLAIALAALLAIGLGPAILWFAAYVASVVAAVVIAGPIHPVYTRPDAENQAALALIATGIVVFAIMLYFVRQRDRFQQRSDDLLHNILPDEIAARLKDAPAMIADTFESASVLFADVVDFTPMSATMPASELVALLDEIFTTFDGFAAELGLEKIKTVGDAYMVASGVPVPRPDHAEAIARLALRMRDHTASGHFRGHPIRIRIGINSGPLVAGIIGKHKFTYDLWGDTVNTASRMESSGVPGKIQLTPSTHELIQERFLCESRGIIAVRGKGEMETFLLVSMRASSQADPRWTQGESNP